MAKFDLIKTCILSALIIVLISDNLVLGDANFVSVPTTVKTFENDSVLLPCYSKGIHYLFFDAENYKIHENDEILKV